MPDNYQKVNNVADYQVTNALRRLSGFCVIPSEKVKQWLFRKASKDILLAVFVEELNICLSNAKALVEEIEEMRSFAEKKPSNKLGFYIFSTRI